MRKMRTWREMLIAQLAESPEEAIDFLQAVLEEYQTYGNPAAVQLALHSVVESRGGISEPAQKTGIAPQTLSEVLSSDEAPRIDTLRTLLTALGCRLSIEPLENASPNLEISDENCQIKPAAANLSFQPEEGKANRAAMDV